MKRQRNLITRLLMTSSVFLLTALQGLWLTNSYEKAYLDFRKETSMLLKNSIAALRDSLFVRLEEPYKSDSVVHRGNLLFRRDSSNLKFRGEDSANVFSEKKFIVSHGIRLDSSVTYTESQTSSTRKPDGQRTFVVHLGPDTLDADLLSKYYKKSLGNAGIFLPFQINTIMHRQIGPDQWPDELSGHEELRSPKIYSDTIITDPARFIGPFTSYVAVFPGLKGVVLKEIAPQILFSALLTVIIVTSFIVTYRSLRSQQRLNDLKNDFINNVTHELKTPVATVSVALEALKDFHALDNPERTKEYLSIAQNELARLSLMTDKILKASSFETQGVAYVTQNVNLHSIIQRVLSSLKLVFEKNNLQVAYTPTGSNFELRGSEIHLTNVIYNLVDNALKYGNGQSNIELSLTASDDHLDFSIRDYGIGIAKEYQKKIFDKFFRVPTGDVHDIKGYGLGLNYVAGVVQKHGGTIGVESEIGKGSLFKVRLPKNCIFHR
jgi:two-component system, OmpR family, phosphate regulon sensor histidine kinase PhoR